MSEPGDNDDMPEADDVLNRADALLNRHRAAGKAASNAQAIPAPSRSVADALGVAAIPTLTELVQTPAEASSSPPESDTHATPAQGGEIIPRVQAQSHEHGVYQKLK